MNAVTFLIPCHNNETTVLKTLQSLENLQTDSTFDVVVVDDGSADRSAALVTEYLQHSNLAVRFVKKNCGGEASALNTGLPYCSGKFIALVEADVELYPDWLTEVLKEFKENSVAGVGGYIEVPKNDNWIARIAGYEIEYKFRTKNYRAKHISSANAIYRREIFDLFGPFNEKLLNASLDADFNSRIIAKGYTLIYCENARVYHHYKTTFTGYLERQYAYGRYRPYLENLDLYPQDRLLAINIIFCAGLLVALLLYFVKPVLAFYYAIFVFLLQIPQTVTLLMIKKDPVLFILPLVLILRNIVGGTGYLLGYIKKCFHKY